MVVIEPGNNIKLFCEKIKINVMKKTVQILTLTALMVLSFTCEAKSQGGVYMTPSDFVNRKLSYEHDSRILLNNSVLELPYITVIDHDKKLKLKKNEIFGYVDRNKAAHRFYGNTDYQIAEAGSIIIYVQTERIAESKGYKVKKNFFFSTSAGSEIIRLTVDNLKNAYRTNEKFLDLLDQYMSNGDVAAYDNIHNTYKVNYVYAKAMK